MASKEPAPWLCPIFEIVGDQELRVDVYLPSKKTGKVNRPIVFVLHAGAWIFGSSRLINTDQLEDCLSRDWIVLSPQFHLCPQVDILEGPMGDMRACLAWVQSGGADRDLSGHGLAADLDRIAAHGMSSGGSLALCLGFDVPKPVRAVFAVCPTIICGHPKWFTSVQKMTKLSETDPAFMQQVYQEQPIPVEGDVRIDDRWCPLKIIKEPWLTPRSAFMYAQMAKGKLLTVCYPKRVETGDFKPIDPYLNVTEKFPATCIAQGAADDSVPFQAPQGLVGKLWNVGIRAELAVIPGAEHMFTATMRLEDMNYKLQQRGFDFLQECFDGI